MQGSKKTPRKKRKGKRVSLRARLKRIPFLDRFIRRFLVLLLILALLPPALSLIYAVPFTRPISTLMVRDWIAAPFSNRDWSVRRDWLDFESIPPHIWQSVMMSEDGKFCEHWGIDWSQMRLVVSGALDGKRAKRNRTRGASTISMQSAKNLFLWPGRSYIRKALELPLAAMIDALWGKKRLMEIYLNIAEWGPGIYGIEAAARHHFNRSAKKLTRRQAALLAASLPNPHTRNPAFPSRSVRRLARIIEKRAWASKAYNFCLE